MTAATATIDRRRVLGLARVNAKLLTRNPLTLTYALVLPLLPFAMLLAQDPDQASGVSSIIATTLLMSMLFPVFYNLLSMFVTRRDELVLKRLRTGEATDGDILVAMALPGLVIALVISLVCVPLALVLGVDAPANPVLLLLGALLGGVAFSALAIWTASWTRNAEAAQLTSMPVLTLAVAGLMAPALPESAQQWATLLPGGALLQIVRIGWFALPADPGAGGSLSFGETWLAAAPALGVLAVLTALACHVARRELRWEPRG